MPNEAGKNLETAQEAIAALTGGDLSVTRSTDALGRGRPQTPARLWDVCSQSPEAGSTVTAKTIITFSTVRTEIEQCPS
jgi:hypothetical protein